MFGVDVRVLFCTLYCLPTQQDQTWQGLNYLVRLWVPVACCTTHDRAGDQEPSNVFTMWGFSLERNGVPEKNHAEVWINPFVGNTDQAVDWLKISPKRQTNFSDIGSLLRGKAVRQENLNSTDFHAQFAYKRCPWNWHSITQVLLNSLRRSYNRWPRHGRWNHLHHEWAIHIPKAAFPAPDSGGYQAAPKTIVYWKSTAGYVFLSKARPEKLLSQATWFRTHQTTWKCVWCSEVQTETGQ